MAAGRWGEWDLWLPPGGAVEHVPRCCFLFIFDTQAKVQKTFIFNVSNATFSNSPSFLFASFPLSLYLISSPSISFSLLSFPLLVLSIYFLISSPRLSFPPLQLMFLSFTLFSYPPPPPFSFLSCAFLCFPLLLLTFPFRLAWNLLRLPTPLPLLLSLSPEFSVFFFFSPCEGGQLDK